MIAETFEEVVLRTIKAMEDLIKIAEEYGLEGTAKHFTKEVEDLKHEIRPTNYGEPI